MRHMRLRRLLALAMILPSLVSVIVMASFFLYHEFHRFNEQAGRIRAAFIADQEKLIQREVDRVIQFLRLQEAALQTRFAAALRSRTLDAVDVVSRLHGLYRDLLRDGEMRALILETVRNIRYHEGRKGFIVCDDEGRILMDPLHPDRLGTSFFSHILVTPPEAPGREHLQGRPLTAGGPDGFLTWRWRIPDANGDQDVTGFFQRFAPLGWWIGTAQTIHEARVAAQRDCLDWVNEIRFDENGYIFIYDDTGLNLAHFRESLRNRRVEEFADPAQIAIVRELIQMARNGDAGFLRYRASSNPSTGLSAAKVSHVRYFDPWGWVVGSGFYEGDIELRIAMDRAKLNDNIREFLIQTLALLCLLSLSCMGAAGLLFRRVENNLIRFSDFFDRAAHHAETMEVNRLYFPEFREVAVCANRMIDERRRAEKALRASEEWLAMAVSASSQVIWRWRLDTGVIHWDERIRDITGHFPEELGHTRSWRAIIHPEDRESVRRATIPFVTGENAAFQMEYRVQAKDGEWKWIMVHGRLARREEEPSVALGTCMDITLRKRDESSRAALEAQVGRLRKMEALGLLAGGVAHDLNNVLSGIVGYPELMIRNLPGDSPLRGPLERIHQSGRRAAAIVEDLLTLARRGVVRKEPVEINALVGEYLVSPEYEKLLRDHPAVRVEFFATPEPAFVNGSAIHIKKSLMNLVLNAAEAQPDGGSIRVSTALQEIDRPLEGYQTVPAGRFVTLTVEDDGVGMSAGDLEHVFEPFYTKKVMGRSGTGLGMAVVWGTVLDHGGYIHIDSHPGAGTGITLFLPAAPAPPAAARPPAAEIQGRGQTILVVDDLADQRDLARQLLETLGYRALAAASGEMAVEVIRDHPADLVMLDMIMDPGIDGLETYRRIIAIRPGQRAVIASGFSETGRVREALALGVAGYLQKPYTLTTLGVALKKALTEAPEGISP